jgi:hypothetical protein
MAADTGFEREDIIHRKGYDRFIGLMRWSAVICAVIALLVIFAIAK